MDLRFEQLHLTRLVNLVHLLLACDTYVITSFLLRLWYNKG